MPAANILGFKAQLSPKKTSNKTYPTQLINHPSFCFILNIFTLFLFI